MTALHDGPTMSGFATYKPTRAVIQSHVDSFGAFHVDPCVSAFKHAPGRLLGGLVYRVMVEQVRQTHLHVADVATQRHVGRYGGTSRLVETTPDIPRQHRPVASTPVREFAESLARMVLERYLYANVLIKTKLQKNQPRSRIEVRPTAQTFDLVL